MNPRIVRMVGVMLGEQLRELRLERGLTLKEAARRLEGALSDAGLSRIETGERQPNLTTLEALAQLYDVTIQIGPTFTTISEGDCTKK